MAASAPSSDKLLSSSITIPVIAGLAVGIVLIIIVSLIPIGIPRAIQPPLMSLVTVNDGKSYETRDNGFCGQFCDILSSARVISMPQIEVSKGSEIAFRIVANSRDGQQQQPSDLHFIITEIQEEKGANSTHLRYNQTTIQLSKTANGNYATGNLPAGRYLIKVIADWNSEQNPDFSHSFHRFTINITTEDNAYHQYQRSTSPSELKADYPNGTISVVVTIPEGASSLSPAKNFEPSTIKVVIGTNNTVRWINQDSALAMIAADNESEPGFYNATKNFVLIDPNKTFEYTFTKAGEFGYHGRPWQRGTVIVVAASASASSSSGAPSSAHYLLYDGLGQVPASHILNGSYDGIDKDSGIVTINNQRYYLTMLNHTASEIQSGESIDFHNVTFSFPYGAFLTPGGVIFIPDIKFQDGSEEVYGRSTTFADGGGYMSGIGIPSSPHASKEPITAFSNHTYPQAALTVYNENVKLLVSVDR